MKKALGLIETRGLVAAVAAADRALKSAKVILEGKEITEPGYVTIRFTGELSEIQIAVSAASEAARDTGELISSLVLADPDSQLSLLMGASKPFIQTAEKDVPSIPKVTKKDKSAFAETTLKKDKSGVEETSPKRELEFFIDAPSQVQEKESAPEKKDPPDSGNVLSAVFSSPEPSKISSPPPTRRPKVSTSSKVSASSPSEGEGWGEVSKREVRGEVLDTIARLRMEALGQNNDNVPENLNVNERTGQDLNELNVHQLRKLARSTPDFPIFGRKISKANRDELLKLFNGLNN